MFRVLMQDSGPGAAISRRRVLADGGRGLVAFALLGGSITACGSGAPSGPDPLEEQAELARQDSALATAAAVGAPPALARAFTEIAAERSRHAAALVEEIARAARTPVPTSSSTTTSAAAAQAPSLDDVATALRNSADSATKVVPTLSGYRAGLLGSVAASCTALYTVALPSRKPAQ